jgi:hypothetical protein
MLYDIVMITCILTFCAFLTYTVHEVFKAGGEIVRGFLDTAVSRAFDYLTKI